MHSKHSDLSFTSIISSYVNVMEKIGAKWFPTLGCTSFLKNDQLTSMYGVPINFAICTLIDDDDVDNSAHWSSPRHYAPMLGFVNLGGSISLRVLSKL